MQLSGKWEETTGSKKVVAGEGAMEVRWMRGGRMNNACMARE